MGDDRIKELRIIKRYGNRKLYDTRESRYINLKDIAKLIERGEEIKIIDNSTGEDITSIVLAQVVYTKEKKEKTLSIIPQLKELIQKGEKKFIEKQRESQNMIKEFLEAKKQDIEEIQKKIDERIRLIVMSIVPLKEIQKEISNIKRRVEQIERFIDSIQREITSTIQKDKKDE